MGRRAGGGCGQESNSTAMTFAGTDRGVTLAAALDLGGGGQACFPARLHRDSHATDIIETSCGLSLGSPCLAVPPDSVNNRDLGLLVGLESSDDKIKCYTLLHNNLPMCETVLPGTLPSPHNGILKSCILPAEHGRLHTGRSDHQNTVGTGSYVEASGQTASDEHIVNSLVHHSIPQAITSLEISLIFIKQSSYTTLP